MVLTNPISVDLGVLVLFHEVPNTLTLDLRFQVASMRVSITYTTVAGMAHPYRQSWLNNNCMSKEGTTRSIKPNSKTGSVHKRQLAGLQIQVHILSTLILNIRFIYAAFVAIPSHLSNNLSSW